MNLIAIEAAVVRANPAALLHAIPIGLCHTWHDLALAAEGTNRYGGDTAEIYAYRFAGWSPPAGNGATGEAMRAEYDRRASAILSAILIAFCEEYKREVQVDGVLFCDGLMPGYPVLPPNGHRWHVRVWAARACPVCNGSGRTATKAECSPCNGSGYVDAP